VQLIAGIVSSVVGPALALFILGAVSKHANWKVGYLASHRYDNIIFDYSDDEADANGYDDGSAASYPA